MKDKTLAQFLNDHTQAQTAEIVGVYQSAISQMIASGRQIYLRKTGADWYCYEIKPIGKSALTAV